MTSSKEGPSGLERWTGWSCVRTIQAQLRFGTLAIVNGLPTLESEQGSEVKSS